MGTERRVVVETVQLTKLFRDFWLRPKVKALDNVDLQVRRGEIFGLLGPNGSGKSTLVKILLGLLFPTSGRAAVFGRDPRNTLIKDRIGYMPEESYLYRYLNAEETLTFYGRLFNLPRQERKHRVALLLDMVGLTRQSQRPIVEYSKGMARRIGLAQALINDPDLVFLDEPTTGLDPIGTREIKDLILELKQRNKTVLLCSHLLSDVEDVCDRVAILYGGRVRKLGNMDDLLEVRAKTQITADQLADETVAKVLKTIEDAEGADKEVTVEVPRDRLESFFLRVVEEAREARVSTAGTTTGTGAASFFEGIEREDKAAALLDELLKPAAMAHDPGTVSEKAPVVLPAGKPQPQADRAMLSDLVKEAGGPSKPAADDAETQRPAPVVLPAGDEKPDEEARRDVLDGLLKAGRGGAEKPPDESVSEDGEGKR